MGTAVGCSTLKSTVKTTGKLAGKTAAGLGKVATLPFDHEKKSSGYNVGRGSYSYTVRGKRYHVMSRDSARRYEETGYASWYGREGGNQTATGERYRPWGMTAAHKTLPLGTRVRVTNLGNGRSVVLRVNDRGPFVRGRIIDCSKGAASKLGYIDRGITKVRVEAL